MRRVARSADDRGGGRAGRGARVRRLVVGLVLIGLTAPACSHGGVGQAVGPSTTTSSTPPTTTSTTAVTTPLVAKVYEPFYATVEPDDSSTEDSHTRPAAVSHLIRVALEHHKGYDRYLFMFNNDVPGNDRPIRPTRPAWTAGYVPRSSVVMDESDEAVELEGAAALRIVFRDVVMRRADGGETSTHPLPGDHSLAFGGDFQGYVTWFLGVDGRRPFRVNFVKDEAVAVEIVT
jgi:hypothetical protein